MAGNESNNVLDMSRARLCIKACYGLSDEYLRSLTENEQDCVAMRMMEADRAKREVDYKIDNLVALADAMRDSIEMLQSFVHANRKKPMSLALIGQSEEAKIRYMAYRYDVLYRDDEDVAGGVAE